VGVGGFESDGLHVLYLGAHSDWSLGAPLNISSIFDMIPSSIKCTIFLFKSIFRNNPKNILFKRELFWAGCPRKGYAPFSSLGQFFVIIPKKVKKEFWAGCPRNGYA